MPTRVLLKRCVGIPNPPNCWGSLTNHHFDIHLWNAVKRAEICRANRHCEFCAKEFVEEDLTLHFSIAFDQDTSTASLHRYDVLCVMCHELMHIGRASSEGRLQTVKQHYADVMEIFLHDADRDFEAAREKHNALRLFNWTTDTSAFHSIPAVREWKKKNDFMCVAKNTSISAWRAVYSLGNTCCYAVCNKQCSLKDPPPFECDFEAFDYF